MAAATVKGVVALAKGAPVEVRDIVVPDPGPGEARVTVQACGVCHTDLHYREGAINDDFPFLLGHEAAGVVESVGPDVTEVAPGDFVVLNWRAVCGTCRACRRGRPWYCFATFNATQKMTLTDGTELSPALGIGAFAEQTLVAAGQATKVNPAAKPETAGLLGCGVMADPAAPEHRDAVAASHLARVHGCAEAGHHAAPEQARGLGPGGGVHLGGLAGGDQRLLGERADAERGAELGAVGEGHLLGRVEGGEAVPGASPATGAAGAAHHTPVEDDEVAGRDLGDVGPDRLDHSRRLVPEEEGEVVVDRALPVVQVGVAHAARLHGHARLAGTRVGHDDLREPRPAHPSRARPHPSPSLQP